MQDSFGQAITDPFSPVTPETRENVNYFTTGPSLEFLLGGQQARAVRHVLADRLRDAARSTATASSAASRSAEPISRRRRGMTFNAVTEQVDFDDETAADYGRRQRLPRLRDRGRAHRHLRRGRLHLARSGDWRATRRPAFPPRRDARAVRVVDARTDASARSSPIRATRCARPSTVGAHTRGAATVRAAADPFENRFASLDLAVSHATAPRCRFGGDWSDDTYEDAVASSIATCSPGTRSAERAAVGRWSMSLNATLMRGRVRQRGASSDTLDHRRSAGLAAGPDAWACG